MNIMELFITASAISGIALILITFWELDFFGSRVDVFIPEREDPFYLGGTHILFDGFNKEFFVILRNRNNRKGIVVKEFSIYIQGQQKSKSFSFPDKVPKIVNAGTAENVDIIKDLSTLRKDILSEKFQIEHRGIEFPGTNLVILGKMFQMWIKIKFDNKEKKSKEVPLFVIEKIYHKKEGRREEIKQNQDQIEKYIIWYGNKQKKKKTNKE